MKYIKRINEGVSDSKLDTAVNMVISTMKYIDKNFKWTSEFYDKGEFNYSIKYWIHFKGYTIADTIWRHVYGEVIDKSEIKDFILRQEPSIWEIIEEEERPINDLHFIVNIGTQRTGGQDHSYIQGKELSRNTDRYDHIEANQKDSIVNHISKLSNNIKLISDNLNKLKTDKVTEIGFSYPNFWMNYDFTFDVTKVNNDTLTKINQ